MADTTTAPPEPAPQDQPSAPIPLAPPEFSGSLTPEQQALAVQWINSHWTNRACPFHGPTNWGIDRQLAWAGVYTPGRLVLGGPIFPFLVVTCGTCGYVVFLSAIKLGLVPGASDSPQPPPVESGGS